jgi:hypothetical protein
VRGTGEMTSGLMGRNLGSGIGSIRFGGLCEEPEPVDVKV